MLKKTITIEDDLIKDLNSKELDELIEGKARKFIQENKSTHVLRHIARERNELVKAIDITIYLAPAVK